MPSSARGLLPYNAMTQPAPESAFNYGISVSNHFDASAPGRTAGNPTIAGRCMHSLCEQRVGGRRVTRKTPVLVPAEVGEENAIVEMTAKVQHTDRIIVHADGCGTDVL